MTVNTTTNRNDYVGDGSQTTFAYTCRIFAATDLEVYLDGVLQTLGVHYTVTGVGNPTGGNVVFTTAPASGAKVAILRAVPYTQLVDYVSNDPFPAETHELALDKVTILTQQLLEKSQRALTLPPSNPGDATVPPPVRGGELLRWKPDKSGLDLIHPDGLNIVPNPMLAEGDLIRGDVGGQPARLAAGANQSLLYVNTNTPAWLPLGADGTYLRSVGGALTWDPGFQNPMTAAGDLIVGGAGGAPTRLGIGADGFVLKASGGTPVWSSVTASPTIIAHPGVHTGLVGSATVVEPAATNPGLMVFSLPDAATTGFRFTGPAQTLSSVRVLVASSGSASGDVVLTISAMALGSGDSTHASTPDTSVTITVSVTGSGGLPITDATATFALTPAAGDRVIAFRVVRVGGSAGDTLAAAAYLVAVIWS